MSQSRRETPLNSSRVSAIITDEADRTYLLLAAILLLVLVVVAFLAVQARGRGEESSRLLAELLPTPAGRLTPAPTPPATPTPVAPTPTPVTTWYFAEGSSAAGFQTWLLLLNPGDLPARTTLTYFREVGEAITETLTLPAHTRRSVLANARVPTAAFGARIEADQPVYAERSLFFGQDVNSVAGQPLSREWYLPAGDTRPGAETWLQLLNPHPATVQVTVDFVSNSGLAATRSYPLNPQSRRNVHVNAETPGIGVSLIVRATQPIVAERATFLNNNQAGHGSAGAPALASTWYFAEGNSEGSYDTTLVILNPGAAPANLVVTFYPEGKPVVQKTSAVPAGSRVEWSYRTEVPGSRPAAIVRSDQPIAVERVTRFNNGRGANATLGMTAPQHELYFAEGATASPYNEFLILFNPGSTPAQAVLTFYREDGTTSERTYTLKAASRLALGLNAEMPNVPGLGVRVRSEVPLVADRVTYLSNAPGGSASSGQ